MLKHLILWTLKEGIEKEEKERILKEIKESLEGLKGKIEGLCEMKVVIDTLPSSNVDFILDSDFTDEEALKCYASHPLHVKVAEEKILPYKEGRHCIDYIY